MENSELLMALLPEELFSFDSYFGFAFLFNVILFFIIIIIASCRLFKKMGEKPYKALIPFYNDIVMFRRFGFSIVLPVIHIASTLYYYVIANFVKLEFVTLIAVMIMSVTFIIIQFKKVFALSDYFGKSSSFKVGLLLLNPVFLLILAFGRSRFLKNEVD